MQASLQQAIRKQVKVWDFLSCFFKLLFMLLVWLKNKEEREKSGVCGEKYWFFGVDSTVF